MQVWGLRRNNIRRGPIFVLTIFPSMSYSTRWSHPMSCRMRLAQMVGKVAATYAVKTADIRARPGGVQIVFELLPKAPYATRYRIIDEIETVARSIGYGALRMPIDPETGIGDIEGTTIRMTFPHPPLWPY